MDSSTDVRDGVDRWRPALLPFSLFVIACAPDATGGDSDATDTSAAEKDADLHEIDGADDTDGPKLPRLSVTVEASPATDGDSFAFESLLGGEVHQTLVLRNAGEATLSIESVGWAVGNAGATLKNRYVEIGMLGQGLPAAIAPGDVLTLA